MMKDWAVCARRDPGDEWSCTLEDGHDGPHVAEGMLNVIAACWAQGAKQRADVLQRGMELGDYPAELNAMFPELHR